MGSSKIITVIIFCDMYVLPPNMVKWEKQKGGGNAYAYRK